MTEILLVYFVFLVPYPFVTLAYALDQHLQVAGWLVIGITLIYLLQKFNLRKALFAFILLWFMPSTLICGAATLIPWVFAFSLLFGQSGCVTWVSLAITFVLNTTILYCFVWLYGRWKQRKKSNA